MKVAVMGLRHGHIHDLMADVRARPDLQIVAIGEEDAKTREAFMARGTGEKVFASYAEMLRDVECDIIAVGDYFGKRGAIVLEALRSGKHVISDKPICTSPTELAGITEVIAQSDLKLGCHLDIRDHGNFRALRSVVRSGEIGDVRAIGFGGQHPLMRGTRPDWYFEAGKHGGTINDIAVHAINFIPWITGHEFSTVHCARSWNAGLPHLPHFKNAAQVMLSLDNGCGVIGDVSYFAPDSFGYSLPYYWRVTFWGLDGVAETGINAAGVTLYRNGESQPRVVPPAQPRPAGYLKDFLAEINGEKADAALTTGEVLRAAYVALQAQRAADEELANVSLQTKAEN